MYITNGTFYTGKPGEIEVIEAGEEVTAKTLGVPEATCKRYVKLGTLIEKPAPKKGASDKGDADKGAQDK